nr:reverse transcriptase domain-containing protein [Tanacetum cinerariifolium]
MILVKEEEQVVAWFLGVIKPEIVDVHLKLPPTTSAAGTTRERVDNAHRCYKCGRLRHYARDCLNLKALAFVPNDACLIYDTDAELELDEPGDEVVTSAKSVEVDDAATTSQIFKDDVTMDQTLMEIKEAKPNVGPLTSADLYPLN